MSERLPALPDPAYFPALPQSLMKVSSGRGATDFCSSSRGGCSVCGGLTVPGPPPRPGSHAAASPDCRRHRLPASPDFNGLQPVKPAGAQMCCAVTATPLVLVAVQRCFKFPLLRALCFPSGDAVKMPSYGWTLVLQSVYIILHSPLKQKVAPALYLWYLNYSLELSVF